MPRSSVLAFKPAAGRRGLTALYDPVLALTMRESAWRPCVLDELSATDAGERIDRVLDVGCGTGTLTIAIAARLPQAIVAGLDPDSAILRRAEAKAGAAGTPVQWRPGSATALPFGDGHFDRIACTLVLHHLLPDRKFAALQEIRRVLAPAGRLVVADWGPPQDPAMRAAFFGLQLLDGFHETSEHARGLLPARMAAAGLGDVRRVQRVRTGWGSLEVLTATRS